MHFKEDSMNLYKNFKINKRKVNLIKKLKNFRLKIFKFIFKNFIIFLKNI
jgi:hypothetical protein